LADIWLEQYGDEALDVETGEALFGGAAPEVGYMLAVLAWLGPFGGVNWLE